VECADGKEALQAIAKHPDLALVFLDLIMPQITGTHFLKMIRKMDALSGVPIIVTSGNTTLKVIKELQALDVAGFLVKPISQDKILNSVEKLSKSKQQKSPPLKSSP
jgi:CheY-like chemotaxis protein